LHQNIEDRGCFLDTGFIDKDREGAGRFKDCIEATAMGGHYMRSLDL